MAPTSAKSTESRELARAAAAERIRLANLRSIPPGEWAQAIAEGNRDALSRGITLVESRSAKDRPAAEALLQAALALGEKTSAVRLGITGIPGVGKSTFIERFGQCLIDAGHRVAVLAVDPSSKRSKGSLLGDKTRMEELVKAPDAFVRPSPAADSLGGVTRATSEAIILCETAGFDRILVETVGVGQSETAVREMTDAFLLLLISGAGDDLQGIKRGIMEMADLVIVNKADGDQITAAEQTAQQCRSAMHLMPPPPHKTEVEVITASGLEGAGLAKVVEHLENLEHVWKASGWWEHQRATQLSQQFQNQAHRWILDDVLSTDSIREVWDDLESQVVGRQLSPYTAARMLAARLTSS